MKSTQKNVHGQFQHFALGTQRHLYSTDWCRGLASGVSQILGLASGVTQILALGNKSAGNWFAVTHALVTFDMRSKQIVTWDIGI